MNIKALVENANPAQLNRVTSSTAFCSVKNPEDGKTYLFPVELADLGQATINKVEKAITLMRYIRKALEQEKLFVLSPEETPTEKSGIIEYYRAGVVYYRVSEEGTDYLVPLRLENAEKPTLHQFETLTDLQPYIEAAKAEGTYLKAA